MSFDALNSLKSSIPPSLASIVQVTRAQPKQGTIAFSTARALSNSAPAEYPSISLETRAIVPIQPSQETPPSTPPKISPLPDIYIDIPSPVDIPAQEEGLRDAKKSNSFWEKLTSKVSEAVSSFLNTRVDVGLPGTHFRLNLNVIKTGKDIVTSLTTSVPDNKKLLDSIDRVRQKTITAIETIPESFATPAPALNTSIDATQLLQTTLQSTQGSWNMLVGNVINCASLTIFHEKILGIPCKNSFDFYNKFVHSSNPLQAYTDTLPIGRRFAAKILLPIIRWFIKLILQPRADLSSGMNNLQSRLISYFADNGKTRDELFNCVKIVTDYFSLRKRALEQYNTIATNPSIPCTLTQEQYVAKFLEDNLSNIGLTERKIFDTFNEWIIDTINIQSGIPLIGWIVDRILKAILKTVIHNLDPAKLALHKALDKKTRNFAFAYSIQSLISEELQELIDEKIQERDFILAHPEQEYSNATDPEELPDHEKKSIRDFLTALFEYLPIDKATSAKDLQAGLHGGVASLMRDFEETRTKSAKVFDEYIIGHFADWEKEIQEAILDLSVEIGASLVKKFTDGKTLTSSWDRLLKMVSKSLFTTSSSQRVTPEDLDVIKQKVGEQLNALIDIGLDILLRDEKRALEKDMAIKKENIHVNKIRSSLEANLQSLAKLMTLKESALASLSTKDLQENSYRFIFFVKKLINDLSLSTDALLSLKECELETKERIKRNIEEVVTQLDLIVDLYPVIQNKIDGINQLTPTINDVSALTQDTSIELDIKSILPGKSYKHLSASFDLIEPQLDAFEDKSLLKTQLKQLRSRSLDIYQKNITLQKNEQLKDVLGRVQSNINYLLKLNAAPNDKTLREMQRILNKLVVFAPQMSTYGSKLQKLISHELDLIHLQNLNPSARRDVIEKRLKHILSACQTELEETDASLVAGYKEKKMQTFALTTKCQELEIAVRKPVQLYCQSLQDALHATKKALSAIEKSSEEINVTHRILLGTPLRSTLAKSENRSVRPRVKALIESASEMLVKPVHLEQLAVRGLARLTD